MGGFYSSAGSYWQASYSQEARDRDRAEQDRKDAEDRKRWENQKKYRQRNDRNRFNNKIFEAKEPMSEVKIHNGKRVILMSFLSREFGTDNRFGILNFCIYSETFNPEDFKKFTNDVKFKIECANVQYFRDHHLVKQLWLLDKYGYEVQIYSSDEVR
jgi:hypothetical protein